MAIFYVTETTFPEVIKSPLPVLVDFCAVWCRPCGTLVPHLEALEKTYAGKLRIVKCDIDRSRGVAQWYDIRSVPTLLLFSAGKVVGQITGVVPRTKIEDMIRKVVG